MWEGTRREEEGEKEEEEEKAGRMVGGRQRG